MVKKLCRRKLQRNGLKRPREATTIRMQGISNIRKRKACYKGKSRNRDIIRKSD